MRGATGSLAFHSPVPVTSEHVLETFDCGNPRLNDWLKTHALRNEGTASRTFVAADDGMNVLAYYTLATGSVILSEVPRKLRQGLPNPVPVMILGRLAVDRRMSGKRLGPALLKEAMVRTLRVSEDAGVRALIVHAIDDAAIEFYAKYSFQIFPHGTRTMFLPIEVIAAAAGAS